MRSLLGVALATVCVCSIVASAAEDLYSILGVTRGASDRDIRKKFRKLSMELHPDVNPDPAVKDRYAKVMKAYSVVSDPKKRENYDRFGVVDGEDDRRPQGGFNPFGARARGFAPIASQTPTMTFSDYYRVHQYRGRRIQLIQVYHSQAMPCHIFAPAWEHLAQHSALKHTVKHWRIDAERDSLLLEIAEMHSFELPALFAMVDGTLWPMMGLPISNNYGFVARAVEQFVGSLFADVLEELRSNTVYAVPQLKALLAMYVARVPVVLVNLEDPQFERIALALQSKFGDQVDVYPAASEVLTSLYNTCGGDRRLRATSVWVFNTFSDDPCEASRFPSTRLHDEDGILAFVGKRAHKPIPILTNYSFTETCMGTPCIVEATAGLPKLPAITVQLRGSRSGFKPAVVDAAYEAQFLHTFGVDAKRVQPTEVTLLWILANPEDGTARFRTFEGTVSDAADWVSQMITSPAGLKHFAGGPWGLRVNAFPMSTSRRIAASAKAVLASVPGLESLMILFGLWYVVKWIRGGGQQQQPQRTADNPMRSQQERDAQPGNARSASATAPKAPTAQKSAAAAPRSGFASSRTPEASTRGGAPPTSPPSNNGSRTWSGQTDKMAASQPSVQLPRATISSLKAGDIDSAKLSPRKFVLIAFAAVEGAKAPVETAPLLQYPDVIIRTVSLRRHEGLWQWLREHAQQELAAAETMRLPVFVAVRCARGTAAVMPVDRNVQMWMDGVLEGNVPLSLAIDVAAHTDS